MDDDEYENPYIRVGSETLHHINRNIARLVDVLGARRSSGPHPTRLEPAVSDPSESGSDLSNDEEQDHDNSFQEIDCVPEARQCDLGRYREFIKGESRPVLDYLVADDEFDGEISVWEERNATDVHQKLMKTQEKDRQDSMIQPREGHILMDSTEDGWIHSIRINSAIVIRMLRQVSTDEGIAMPQQFEQQPVVFNRPFAFFVHHQSKMRVRLSELHKRLESPEELPGMPLDFPGFPFGTCNHETALKQIQCYVDFVENRVMPEAEMWAKAAELKQQLPRIRFEDLWYLFQPGDLVYLPANSQTYASGKGTSTHQSISRVHSLRRPAGRFRQGGPVTSTYDPLKQFPPPPPPMYPMEHDLLGYFSVCLYHLEFDGECWRAWYHAVHIGGFIGERDVTTLPCYPLRFKDGYEEIVEQGITDGKAMVNLIRERYGFYSGWSIINKPLGGGALDARGRVIKSPTHIESDVLVDFLEAYNTSPQWRPLVQSNYPVTSGITGSIGWRKASPNVELADTHKPTRSARSPIRGRLVVWDGVDSIRASSYWHRDQYLSGRVSIPSGENFALIPRRFYGYSVWERKFFHLDIRSIQPKDTTDSARAFDQLQIESDDKQLIQSLVHSHFHKKDFQAKHGIELQGQDLIRGKGKGLVLLLHGVPGVGKTATAEAVAQKWQKPLFPITCGDLGITAEKVEKALNEIFRLAHLWDCVLLLDEADVFITHRVKVGDLQRNGLVSVFLRMLEYYNGILFLTTNRPGVLDEAVKSRVHLALKYDHLTLTQTEALFEFNMQRLKEIEDRKGSIDPQYRKLHLRKKEILTFAREHYEKSMAKKGVGRWNGRQIRNAFLIAASLAHYGDGEEVEAEDDELQKQLGRTHFEKVDKTTLLYDQYRREMFNRDDDSRAHEQEER